MSVHELTTRAAALPRARPPAQVWAWEGEVDVAAVPALRTTLRAVLDERPTTLVIDLSRVTFLDCAGLSVLVRANVHPFTRVLLQGVPLCVERLLAVTSLTAAFARVADWTPPTAA